MPTVQTADGNIHYKLRGSGTDPLMMLHAGWGTPVNGFEHQIAALGDRFQLIIPHRLGYGRSTHIGTLSPNYHRLAADHMLAVLDHASVPSAHLWGHSDGAVIGAWMAILANERVRSLTFEGGHLYARKENERGRTFMLRIREQPDALPKKIRSALADGHGADYWKHLLWLWTEAWRLLYQRGGDLYAGRLPEVQTPTLVIHGAQDPHTNIDEMEQLAGKIPGARTLFFPDGGHSMHDDPIYVDRIHTAVLEHISNSAQ